jgi:atypical dual specificity phosphatase
MGPSGTGKSTLLRLFAGMAQQHPEFRCSGRVRIEGLDAGGCTLPHAPVLVGQKAELLLSSVWENLLALWPERGRHTRAEQLAFLHARLEALGQGDVFAMRDKPVLDVSTGMRRRIGIVSKSLAPTALLMIDEPTANLPDTECGPLIALIRDLSTSMPVLVVTHNLRHARDMADHVILVASGQVQEAAPVEAFFERPQSESARSFLRSGSCPEVPLDADNHADEETVAADRVAQAIAAIEGQPRPAWVPAEEPATVPNPPRAPAQRPPAQAHPPASKPVADTQAFSPILGNDRMPVPMPAPASPRGRGPRGFVWLLEGQLAGTPKPGIVGNTVADLQALRDAGITHLLSLTEVPFPPQLAMDHGLSCSALPMPDMEAPSITEGMALCAWIDQLLQNGHSVAVHCKAGLGRTGTVLAMYAIWNGQGVTNSATSVAKIRSLNSGMIQSVSQETFIERFAQRVVNAASENGPTVHQIPPPTRKKS